MSLWAPAEVRGSLSTSRQTTISPASRVGEHLAGDEVGEAAGRLGGGALCPSLHIT